MNPYGHEALADTLSRAAHAGRAEWAARMRAMGGYLPHQDAHRWSRPFLAVLAGSDVRSLPVVEDARA